MSPIEDKLIGEQPLTPERGDEIGNMLKVAGCTAKLAGPLMQAALA
jgi:hypothetical protein